MSKINWSNLKKDASCRVVRYTIIESFDVSFEDAGIAWLTLSDMNDSDYKIDVTKGSNGMHFEVYSKNIITSPMTKDDAEQYLFRLFDTNKTLEISETGKLSVKYKDEYWYVVENVL